MLVAWNSENEPVAQLYLFKGDSEEIIRAATQQLKQLLDIIDPKE